MISFDAPDVDGSGMLMSFELTTSDGNGNSNVATSVTSITDTPAKDDGGSLGWLTTLLLPFLWLRRKNKV